MPISEQTKSYIETFIREGDAFDYQKWLANVRAKEAPKLEVGQVGCVQVPSAASSTCAESRSATWLSLNDRNQVRTTSQSGRFKHKTVQQNLRQLALAWGVAQSSRQRDAIYRYLDRVFVLVKKYRQRGRLKHLICKSQQFAGLPKIKKADVYTTVIRATTHDEIDHRAVSKYARALRYCRKHKGDQSLQAFIKSRGGINACAVLYARRKLKSKRN